MAENILLAFNGQLDLRTAYTYSLPQIHNFLADVVNQPGYYGISINQVSELVAIRAEILRLSLPRGEEYNDPSLEPRQHIHRTTHPRWPSARISRFKLLRYRHKGIDFWSATDLLGLFLSSLGPAPWGATKRNFYLPLTAVYGQWCSRLCETVPVNVVQCTWQATETERPVFFLGASMAGYRAGKARTGSWIHVLNRARFYLSSCEPLKLAGWSQKISPSLRAKFVRRGTQFGRCAETYPFRVLLRGHEAPQNLYGLALCKRYLDVPLYDDRLSGAIWQNVWDPCLNCKTLLQIWKGDVNHFLQWYGSEGAPP